MCGTSISSFKMMKYVLASLAVLTAFTVFHTKASCVRVGPGSQNIDFVGGGAGNGNATANGTASAVNGVPGSASVIAGSVGTAAGGSYSNSTLDTVSQGSYGGGLGVICGSANATGANATAGLVGAGNGSGNGSGQSGVVAVSLPPPPSH